MLDSTAVPATGFFGSPDESHQPDAHHLRRRDQGLRAAVQLPQQDRRLGQPDRRRAGGRRRRCRSRRRPASRGPRPSSPAASPTASAARSGWPPATALLGVDQRPGGADRADPAAFRHAHQREPGRRPGEGHRLLARLRQQRTGGLQPGRGARLRDGHRRLAQRHRQLERRQRKRRRRFAGQQLQRGRDHPGERPTVGLARYATPAGASARSATSATLPGFMPFSHGSSFAGSAIDPVNHVALFVGEARRSASA